MSKDGHPAVNGSALWTIGAGLAVVVLFAAVWGLDRLGAPHGRGIDSAGAHPDRHHRIDQEIVAMLEAEPAGMALGPARLRVRRPRLAVGAEAAVPAPDPRLASFDRLPRFEPARIPAAAMTLEPRRNPAVRPALVTDQLRLHALSPGHSRQGPTIRTQQVAVPNTTRVQGFKGALRRIARPVLIHDLKTEAPRFANIRTLRIELVSRATTIPRAAPQIATGHIRFSVIFPRQTRLHVAAFNMATRAALPERAAQFASEIGGQLASAPTLKGVAVRHSSAFGRRPSHELGTLDHSWGQALRRPNLPTAARAIDMTQPPTSAALVLRLPEAAIAAARGAAPRPRLAAFIEETTPARPSIALRPPPDIRDRDLVSSDAKRRLCIAPAPFESAGASIETVTGGHRLTGDAFGVALARAADRQRGQIVIYSARYQAIPYPLGDLPALFGSCSDVIVRAYRVLGYDLQEAVQRARVGVGDRSIDHRRTNTLRRLFAKQGQSFPPSPYPENYKPGDIVTYHRPHSRVSRAHIAIVSDRIAPSGRPYIIHNRGYNVQLEDALFVDRMTGHYRFRPFDQPTTQLRLSQTPRAQLAEMVD